jgi:CRISPR-associated protein Csb2
MLTLTLAITLEFGEYHGTPWHTAHKELAVDWPPSPARLLRALTYAAFRQDEPIDQETTIGLLHKLNQQLPSYYLPPTAYGQWRNARPDVDQQGQVTTGLTLYNAFLRVPSDDRTIYVAWSGSWTEADRALLQQLVSSLSYLGRSESVATWHVCEPGELVKQPNAYPSESGHIKTAIYDSTLKPELLWECLQYTARQAFEQEKRHVMPGVSAVFYHVEPVQLGQVRGGQRPNWVRLTLVSEYPLPTTDALLHCDRLHRKLAQSGLDHFTCQNDRNPVSDAPVVELRPVIEGRHLVGIDLHYAAGFTQTDLALITNQGRGLIWWCGGMVRSEVVEYGPYKMAGTRWRTVTPMLLSEFPVSRRNAKGKARPRLIEGTTMQRKCPEHQAILNLNKQGVLPDLIEAQWTEVDGWLVVSIDGCEVARAKATQRRELPKLPDQAKRPALKLGFDIELQLAQAHYGSLAVGHRWRFGYGAMVVVLLENI